MADKIDFQPDEESLDFQADATPEEIGQLKALGLGAAQGATFGFSDEAAAAIKSALGPQTYEDELKAQQEYLAAAREQNPWTFGAGELTGGILSPASKVLGAAVGASKIATLAPKALSNVAALAAEGALAGGIYGAGTAEEGSRIEGALDAADTGALFGAGIGAAGGVLKSAGKYIKANVEGIRTPAKALDILKNEGIDVTQKAQATETVSKKALELAKDVQDTKDVIRGAAGERLGTIKGELSQVPEQVSQFADELAPIVQDLEQLAPEQAARVQNALADVKLIKKSASDTELITSELLDQSKAKVSAIDQDIKATKDQLQNLTKEAQDIQASAKASDILDRKTTKNVVREDIDVKRNALDMAKKAALEQELKIRNLISPEYRQAKAAQEAGRDLSQDQVRLISQVEESIQPMSDELEVLKTQVKTLTVPVIETRPVARELSRNMQSTEIQATNSNAERIAELKKKLEDLTNAKLQARKEVVDISKEVGQARREPVFRLEETSTIDFSQALQAKRELLGIRKELRANPNRNPDQEKLLDRSIEFLDARLQKAKEAKPELAQQFEAANKEFYDFATAQERAGMKEFDTMSSAATTAESNEQVRLAKLLEDLGRGEISSVQLEQELAKAFDRSPELYGKLVDQAAQAGPAADAAKKALDIAQTLPEQARKLTDIRQTIDSANRQGLGKTNLSIPAITTRAAVGTAKVKQAFDKTAVGSGIGKIYDTLSSDVYLPKFSQFLREKGQAKLADVADTMATMDASKRRSTAFVLQQNAAVRELMKEFAPESEPELDEVK